MSLDSATSATDSLPVPGLSALSGTVQGGVNNLINTGSGFIDRFFPPEKREAMKNKLIKFATERPKLAAFLLSQLALSGPAIALFVIMTITVAVFALVAGLLVGLVGAVLFIAAAAGFALIILLPVLFFTTFAGVAVFLWGLGAYFIVKWFNQKEVPGIHTDVEGGVSKQLGLDGLLGGGGRDAHPSSTPDKPQRKKEPLQEKKNASTNQHTTNHSAHDGDEKENKPPSSAKKPASEGKRTESATGKGTGADVGGKVGDVHKKAGGAAKGVAGGVTNGVGL